MGRQATGRLATGPHEAEVRDGVARMRLGATDSLMAGGILLLGWGLAGLHVSPKLIPASLLPHALFGILLWGLDKYLPRKSLSKKDRR